MRIDAVVFYTFSTIAQSLAGAIGLLGAISLYRVWIAPAARGGRTRALHLPRSRPRED
jgi:hypothetical protein